MLKKQKRWLSLLLALALTIGTTWMPVYADSNEMEADNEYAATETTEDFSAEEENGQPIVELGDGTADGAAGHSTEGSDDGTDDGSDKGSGEGGDSSNKPGGDENTELDPNQEENDEDPTEDLVEDEEDDEEDEEDGIESRSKRAGAAAVPRIDVTGTIEFENVELRTGTGEIMNPDDPLELVSYWQYIFSFDWSAMDGVALEEGDYFTFRVPVEFGEEFVGKPITMLGTDGAPWGEIRFAVDAVDATAVIATAAFNEHVEEKNGVSGSVELNYMLTSQTSRKVLWIFVIDGEVYEYEGDFEFNGVPNVDNRKHHIYKAGEHIGDDYYLWAIRLNEWRYDWNYEIIVTDTLGPGHQLVPVPPVQYELPPSYLYGTEQHPDDNYLFVALIDYNAMRNDYNQLVRNYLDALDNGDPDEIEETLQALKNYVGVYALYEDQAGNIAEIPHDVVTSFMKWGNYMAWDTMAQDYIYMSKAEDFTINETDDGFQIVFHSGIRNRGVIIWCWTEMTDPEATLTNSVEITGYDLETEASIQTGGGATITGKRGRLVLLKTDVDESESLSGATFTLEKDGAAIAPIERTTNQDGSLWFNLQDFYSRSTGYAGEYTLRETRAPGGYALPEEPIKLVLNEQGEITHVNGEAVTGGQLTINGLCQVTDDGLVIAVFNEEADEPAAAVSVRKVDSANPDATLAGATFQLYRLEGTAYVAQGTALTTGSNGIATWQGLTAGSYRLVETVAPSGYDLPTGNAAQLDFELRESAGGGLELYLNNVPQDGLIITRTNTSTTTTGGGGGGSNTGGGNGGSNLPEIGVASFLTTIDDGEVPLGDLPVVTIEDEETPLGSLPQTGGLPVEMFLALGAVMMGSGVAWKIRARGRNHVED